MHGIVSFIADARSSVAHICDDRLPKEPDKDTPSAPVIMVEAVRKDPRWRSIVSNARAIHGALGECLKISDQMRDGELKGATMLFVNAMEHLAASLLGQRRRVGPVRLPERELVSRLRDEVVHIRQLIEANNRLAHELNDPSAKDILLLSTERLNQFIGAIDRKGH